MITVHLVLTLSSMFVPVVDMAWFLEVYSHSNFFRWLTNGVIYALKLVAYVVTFILWLTLGFPAWYLILVIGLSALVDLYLYLKMVAADNAFDLGEAGCLTIIVRAIFVAIISLATILSLIFNWPVP